MSNNNNNNNNARQQPQPAVPSDPAAMHAAARTALAVVARSVGRTPGGNESAVYEHKVQHLIGTFRKVHDGGVGVGGSVGAGPGIDIGSAAGAAAAATGGGRPGGTGMARSYGGRSVAQIVAGRSWVGSGRQLVMRGRGGGGGPASRTNNDNDNGDDDDCGGIGTACPSTSITTEIRRFGEHCSATKFHWSYLSSTDDPSSSSASSQQQQQQQQQPGGSGAGGVHLHPHRTGVTDPLTAHTAPSAPAVSTISLSFSPDGRTLASTHGDHTVKITCCETGKLVRNLEGHPRTPWTVKYHPTNSNIVASGCLGFQVRVWDWNYRPNRRLQNTANNNNIAGGSIMTTTSSLSPGGGGGGALGEHGRKFRNRGDWSPRAVVHHPFLDDNNGLAGGNGNGNGNGGAASSSSSADSSQRGRRRPNYDALPGHYTTYDPYDYDYHLSRGVCLAMIRLQYAIISLSFHPSGHVLACASGSKVHLWDWDDLAGRQRKEWEEKEEEELRAKQLLEGGGGAGGEGGNAAAAAAAALTGATSTGERPSSAPASSVEGAGRQQQHQSPSVAGQSGVGGAPRGGGGGGARAGAGSTDRQHGGRGGQITEYGYSHALRCVHFPPSGDHIIVGGANPSQNPRGGGMSGGGMTFSLRLFDFDLDAALHPRGLGRSGEDEREERRRAINNSQVLTDRALLYNDGGFDVSPDGTKLCACVEYWLEDGIDDITQLIAKEVEDVQEEIKMYEPENHEGEDKGGVVPKDGLGDSFDKGTANSASFSSPPRQGTIGASSSRTPTSRQASRQGSGEFPPNLSLSDNPKTPPPVAIRPVVPPTPPSPPGRRYPLGTSTGGGQPNASSGTRMGENGSGISSNPQPQGTGRTVVPMPSLSRRQGPGGGRRRRGEGRISTGDGSSQGQHGRGQPAGGPPPPPPPHRHNRPGAGVTFDGGTATRSEGEVGGRWVPHVVTLSLSTVAPSYTPQSTCLLRHQLTREVPLGNITRACRLAGPKASGVTCVKFSPSADYCLLGYGVRENTPSGGDGSNRYHPVTALYGLNRGQEGDHTSTVDSRINGASESQLVHVTTMLSLDDDVNIARFHPESGYGFVYGTKQGRVRVLSPRPWNYYYA